MSEAYVMEALSQSPSLNANSFDIMIIAASGDARSYKGAFELADSGRIIENLVVLKYESQLVHEADPRYESYNKFQSIDFPTTVLNVPNDILTIEPTFLLGKSILVDITGFSIPNLLRLLFFLREIIGVHDFHMIYTEPKYYLFGEDTFGSYEYFIGERQYRALDEFYVSGDDNRELLTIFLGFDRMTSSIVKDAVDPTETILVNGFPAMTPKLKDVSILNNRELISVLGKAKYSIKTNNPFSTYNTLYQIREENPEMLINVCVLGTKTMALGAGVFALLNKGIKLSYAYTKEIAITTSLGVGGSWYYYFKV